MMETAEVTEIALERCSYKDMLWKYAANLQNTFS